MDVNIYYEDTDCGGVVYYANYLRYMERGRTEYLASRGFSVKRLMDEGTVFMVFRVEIDYKAPARYGDVIEVETWIGDATRATMTFEHVMRDKAGGRVFTECRARMVVVDANARPKRLSADFVDKLK
jgi:acyl-CoA thioester hydrolase